MGIKEAEKYIFKKEAKQIPEEALTSEENKLRLKIINDEKMTDEEYEELSVILQECRDYLVNSKPGEQLEALEDNIRLIKTEKELLDALEEDDTLIVDIPIKNKKYRMEFNVKGVDDSRAVKVIAEHLNLFQGNSEEKQKLAEYTIKSKLTPREKKIKESLEKKISLKMDDEQVDAIVSFLAETLTLKDSTLSYEERKEFWKKINVGYRFAIFIKLEKKLGIMGVSSEELFPFG